MSPFTASLDLPEAYPQSLDRWPLVRCAVNPHVLERRKQAVVYEQNDLVVRALDLSLDWCQPVSRPLPSRNTTKHLKVDGRAPALAAPHDFNRSRLQPESLDAWEVGAQ